MASRSVLPEEDLTCPVCYQIFEDPVILFCGHSFCRTCLNIWWTGNLFRNCPVCRKRSPSRNPPRNLALKNLCEAFSQQGLQTSLSEPKEVCSLHSEKLQLFCLDHQQPVYLVCRDSEQHINHTIRPINEVAEHHKAEVQRSLAPLQEKLKVLQKTKGDWVQSADQIKVQAQLTDVKIHEDFKMLQKALQEEHKARICALKEEVNSKSEMVTEKIKGLNREIEDVSDSIRAVEKQLEAPDISFLQKYKAIVKRAQHPLPQDPQRPSGALIDVIKHLENQNQSLVEEIQQMLRAGRPESVDYADVWMKSGLRKYACKLMLDPNTTNYCLSLKDNRKVTWMTKLGGYQSYPDHPDRFTFYPQVLCREGLTGRCYWEVDWRGRVHIGVTYRGISRGDGYDSWLGCNDKSWVLECDDKGYTARHNKISTPICVPSVSNRVGVYVDWPAGSLSFYTVSSDTLTHLHTFYCTFTQPLIPGFSLDPDTSVFLCQIRNTHTHTHTDR